MVHPLSFRVCVGTAPQHVSTRTRNGSSGACWAARAHHTNIHQGGTPTDLDQLQNAFLAVHGVADTGESQGLGVVAKPMSASLALLGPTTRLGHGHASSVHGGRLLRGERGDGSRGFIIRDRNSD